MIKRKKCFKITEEKRELDEIEERTRKALKEREFREMMNSINEDIEFTTETERDFENNRLPTLSFEVWSTENGISHLYFEKIMRSQVLTMKRSSMPDQSKFSILVNELNRRFEVMSGDVTIEEKIEVINKFTKQLVNSGYDFSQTRDIVVREEKMMKK